MTDTVILAILFQNPRELLLKHNLRILMDHLFSDKIVLKISRKELVISQREND